MAGFSFFNSAEEVTMAKNTLENSKIRTSGRVKAQKDILQPL
jgi:hypothetical protein